jgi:hypothetical protein
MQAGTQASVVLVGSKLHMHICISQKETRIRAAPRIMMMMLRSGTHRRRFLVLLFVLFVLLLLVSVFLFLFSSFSLLLVTNTNQHMRMISNSTSDSTQTGMFLSTISESKCDCLKANSLHLAANFQHVMPFAVPMKKSLGEGMYLYSFISMNTCVKHKSRTSSIS